MWHHLLSVPLLCGNTPGKFRLQSLSGSRGFRSLFDGCSSRCYATPPAHLDGRLHRCHLIDRKWNRSAEPCISGWYIFVCDLFLRTRLKKKIPDPKEASCTRVVNMFWFCTLINILYRYKIFVFIYKYIKEKKWQYIYIFFLNVNLIFVWYEGEIKKLIRCGMYVSYVNVLYFGDRKRYKYYIYNILFYLIVSGFIVNK